MTPADLQIPKRGSAPVDDPAVAAGKEAHEAGAAFDALPKDTDEDTPLYKAAEKRMAAADEAFAAAPITSAAGALAKMRLIVDFDEAPDRSSPKYLTPRHFDTVVAFLEAVAGEAQTEPLIALSAEWNRVKALADAAVADDELNSLCDDLRKIEYKIVNTESKTLAGVVVQIKLREDIIGYHHWNLGAAWTRNVIAALERMGGGVVTEPDPVVSLFAEWGTINEEVMALSAAISKGAGTDMKKTAAVPGKPWVAEEEKEWDAALDRREAVEKKILETPATSMRGVAVKIRLVTHCAEGTDLTPFYATPAREIDYEKECIVLECEAVAAISALRDAERLAGVS